MFCISLTATGNAVIEMQRPRNTVRMTSSSNIWATATPLRKGIAKLITARIMPRPRMAPRTSPIRISRPALKIMRNTANSEMPAKAAVGWIKSRTAGPRRIPARISPMSSGWLYLAKILPNNRAATIKTSRLDSRDKCSSVRCGD